MSLIVEDGTGLENANTYISLTYADTYHSELGNADWTGADQADKEAALLRATQYIDGKHGRRWVGRKKTAEQGLDWPRFGAFDSDGWQLFEVPDEVGKATAEAALLVIQGEELTPSLDRGGRVISETVGPISTTYADGAPATPTHTVVTYLLSRVLKPAGIKITR